MARAETELNAISPHQAMGEHESHEQAQELSNHSEHVDHSGHEQVFRNRFWISLFLTIPVLLFNPMVQHWFSCAMPAFPGSQWISPILSAVVFIVGGVPFLQMAVLHRTGCRCPDRHRLDYRHRF